MTTFVTVGNATQPFPRLLVEVERIAHQLPGPLVVQHGRTPFSLRHCVAVPFMGMEEFERNISTATVLIMHAGAGSIIHAVKAGKVPIVMPRTSRDDEAVDDHQVVFARALARQAKVILVESPGALLEAVGIALKTKAVAPQGATRMQERLRDILREFHTSPSYH